MKLSDLVKITTLTLALASNVAWSGSKEEQRKYTFSEYNQEVNTLLTQGGYENGLNIDSHSTYTYMDIYFDTEYFDLFKSGYSFRVRRRLYDDGDISWGIQLKSEMKKVGEDRLEIELDTEDILDYQVKYKGDKVQLIKILNKVFNSVADRLDGHPDLDLDNELDELKEWVKYEVKDALRAPGRKPFEKLVNLEKNPESTFGALDTDTFAPIIAGRSTRVRSHIYVDITNTTDTLSNLKPSEKSKKKTPEYLQADHLIWTMEASFDNSVFIPLRQGKYGDKDWCDDCGRRAYIKEYEVENKYQPEDEASFILGIYEKSLNELGAESLIHSKYHQAASIIYDIR